MLMPDFRYHSQYNIDNSEATHLIVINIPSGKNISKFCPLVNVKVQPNPISVIKAMIADSEVEWRSR